MSWAKVDDRMHSHPKLVRAGLEATGLWARCLSYCAAYATDGVVPRSFVESVTRDVTLASRLSHALTDAGLWSELESGDYQFHDYEDYQESSRVTEHKRKLAAARQKKRREAILTQTGCVTVTRDIARDQRVSHGIPSRPDPSHIQKEEERGAEPPALVPDEPPKPAATRETRQVFEHWQRTLNHPRAMLDGKRERVIAAALKRHGVTDCLAAIDGCARSDFHMGRDPKHPGAVHDDIELILRDAKHVEQFLSLVAPGAAVPPPNSSWGGTGALAAIKARMAASVQRVGDA